MNIEKDGRQYVKCEECEKFATLENASKLGWDWFTGYLTRTNHFCSRHKGSELRRALFNESRTKDMVS